MGKDKAMSKETKQILANDLSFGDRTTGDWGDVTTGELVRGYQTW